MCGLGRGLAEVLCSWRLIQNKPEEACRGSDVTNVFHSGEIITKILLSCGLRASLIAAHFSGVFVLFLNAVLHWSRRHQTAVCQGIFRPEGDTRLDCSFSLFTVRSSNSIQVSGTRQGLISGGCTVAPTVSLQPLCSLLYQIQMFGEVWINIDSVRSCEVPATFCKHFPYHNLNFIINLQSNKPVKKQPCSAINKRAATEHEDTSAFSSAGSLLFRLKTVNVPHREHKYSNPLLRTSKTGRKTGFRRKMYSSIQNKSIDNREWIEYLQYFMLSDQFKREIKDITDFLLLFEWE